MVFKIFANRTILFVSYYKVTKGILIKANHTRYRISNINCIFRFIHSFSGNEDVSNKKRITRNTDPSC